MRSIKQKLCMCRSSSKIKLSSTAQTVNNVRMPMSELGIVVLFMRGLHRGWVAIMSVCVGR